MNNYDRTKASWLKATTVTILSTSLIASTCYNVVKESEVRDLKRQMSVQEHIKEVYENNLVELKYSLTKKSENLVNANNEIKQLESNYKTLELEYDGNLKELQALQEKMKEKKTSRLTEFPKVSKLDNYTSWKKMSVESTAYTKFENGDELGGRKWGNITASGVPVQYGVIAVDTDVIPFGTEVYIPSLNKVFVALDTGSAIKGNMIDVYFDTLHKCVDWGRKHDLEIYVNM